MVNIVDKQRIRDVYRESLRDLAQVERYIYKHGQLDNGLTDSAESFEQGFVNGIEFVCRILNIEV